MITDYDDWKTGLHDPNSPMNEQESNDPIPTEQEQHIIDLQDRLRKYQRLVKAMEDIEDSNKIYTTGTISEGDMERYISTKANLFREINKPI